MDRRAFLRRTLAATAATLATPGVWAVESEAQNAGLHLALLSDTHIPDDVTDSYRGFRPAENLGAAIPKIMAANPEGVLINGDAARLTGETGDYRRLRELLNPLASQCPVYIGLGNHDHRDHFFQVIESLPGDRQPVENHHVVIIRHPELRLIVLDSLLYVNRTAGLLGEAQREWLAEYLSGEETTPIVFCVHHTLGDGDTDLLDAGRLFDLVSGHREVKAIIYGHSHRYAITKHNGIHLINIPATGYNFVDSEPVGWIDARFRGDGVDLQLHAFAGNRAGDGDITQIRWS